MPGYAKQRANWQDFPVTSTPVTAAILNAWESSLYELKRTKLFLADYGAVGDDSTDNATALANAVADLPANGGELIVPYGEFRTSAIPSFDGKRSVILSGLGGLSAGAAQASLLKYTGTGAGSALSARNTFGFAMRDLALTYTSASFTGNLIDITNSTVDPAYATLERCFIGGGSVQTAAALLLLNKAISSTVSDCHFSGAVRAIRGRLITSDYSNAIHFNGCTFTNQTTIHVRDAGEAWTFRDCTFEPLVSGAAGAYSYGANMEAEGLTFDGCWFGDADATGDWINFIGYGLNVRGCQIGNGLVAIRLSNSGNSEGVVIEGNRFQGQTNALRVDNGGTTTRVQMRGNAYTSVTTPVLLTGNPLQSDIEGMDHETIASAATLTLKGSTKVATVTGTTTITSITATYAGHRVTLIFSGILTLTDGSNLKLAGNFVTSADDAIDLVCDGTNWYQTGPGSAN